MTTLSPQQDPLADLQQAQLSVTPGSVDQRLTYVLDTSVLLSDPYAIGRFAEHDVVLPVVVVTELEGKRHHPELGYFARTALRLLDDLRVHHGRLDEPVPIGTDGGTLRVELNHSDPAEIGRASCRERAESQWRAVWRESEEGNE